MTTYPNTFGLKTRPANRSKFAKQPPVFVLEDLNIAKEAQNILHLTWNRGLAVIQFPHFVGVGTDWKQVRFLEDGRLAVTNSLPKKAPDSGINWINADRQCHTSKIDSHNDSTNSVVPTRSKGYQPA